MLHRQHPLNAAAALAATVAALALAPAVSAQLAVAAAGEPGKEAGPAMTQAPMKSNGSGVAVAYRIEGTPVVGVPVSVRMRFGGINDPAGAAVRFTTDGGLSLAASADPAVHLPAGHTSKLSVSVVPGQAGIGYLHVFTTQYGTTSATSVPVQVGQAPASLHAPLGEAKPMPGGEKILPMPVK